MRKGIRGFIKSAYLSLCYVSHKVIDFLVYFGLAIPVIYLIYAAFIIVIYDVNLLKANFQSVMLYIGLAISIICAIIITIKKLFYLKKGEIEPFVDTNPPQKYKKNYNKYTNDIAPYSLQDSLNNGYGYAIQPSQVYQHSKYPGIMCFEYDDRIEFFGINGKELIYLRSQQKK